MNKIKLTHEKLSVDEATQVVTSPKCGAVSLFVGTTRDNFENKQVVQLEYEAYSSMAEKVMQELCTEVRGKWAVENIAIYHRLGTVPVCEASVIIAISSEHRAESLAAVQHTINALKAQVPIWKKEVYGGASCSQPEWKANKESVKQEPVSDDDIEMSQEVPILSKDLVQIKAQPEEVKRRIEAFIKRKRDDVNRTNIRDFCTNSWKGGDEKGQLPEAEDSCARVNAVLVPRKDSKSHLRVRRVMNEWGPQTRQVDGRMPEANFQPSISSSAAPSGVDERLENIEKHLKMDEESTEKPVSKDIYLRLKAIEDKILFLEGVSPEYFSSLPTQINVTAARGPNNEKTKKTYSTKELKERLKNLQQQNLSDSQ